MKQRILSVGIGLAILCSVAVVSAAGLSLGQVVDGVDKRNHTKLNIDEYWKGVKGQQVTWSGTVVDVESGKSKARVLVADKSRPLYKGYNIRVQIEDVPKASKLKKGQTVRFKGSLSSYHSKDAGAVIDISGATIL